MSCNVEYIEAGVKDNFPNDKLPYMFIKGTTVNHTGGMNDRRLLEMSLSFGYFETTEDNILFVPTLQFDKTFGYKVDMVNHPLVECDFRTHSLNGLLVECALVNDTESNFSIFHLFNILGNLSKLNLIYTTLAGSNIMQTLDDFRFNHKRPLGEFDVTEEELMASLKRDEFIPTIVPDHSIDYFVDFHYVK